MSDQERVSKNLAIDVADLQVIDPQLLKQLVANQGIDVSIRSSNPAIDGILGSLRRDVGATAGYERGFDRTSDMYSRTFDRDTVSFNPVDADSTPLKNLSTTSLSDALKRFSLEDLARLKGGR